MQEHIRKCLQADHEKICLKVLLTVRINETEQTFEKAYTFFDSFAIMGKNSI